MAGLIVRRLLQLPLILWVVLTLTFFMCMGVPGDPVQGGDRTMDPEVKRKKRAEYQLDEPVMVQYGLYLHALSPVRLGEWQPESPDGQTPAHWEWRSGGEPWFKAVSFRESIANKLEVRTILAGALPVSLVLGSLALTLAVAVGTFAGIIGAVWRNRWPDYLTLTLALVGVSLPSFVTGATLLIIGSVTLKWFPVGGWGTPAHLVLPAVSLSLPFCAYIARLTRAGMLDSLQQDYVRTATAKGLPPSAVVVKHAFRNAFLPVLSYLGPAAAGILTGSFVVENIFQVPGVGTHFVKAVVGRDYFLILGVVLVYSTLLVLFNLLTDVAYGFLDPRIRAE